MRVAKRSRWRRLSRRLQSPQARARGKKERWERRWRAESERPVEQLATDVPKELKDAVEEGWIAPGSSVMDIGSGRGQVSAWLAERGFSVLGVDIAESATELARRHFSDIGPHLEFRTLNICLDEAGAGRFDAFVDRGCFQGNNELGARYVGKVLTWAKPGARLLLFHRLGDRKGDLETLQKRVERRVRRTFGPHFEIQRAGPTAEPMSRTDGPIPRAVKPGMVFWMTRR
jgi:cyclopropane fatty-acyl-phospholipid synthase-like methyltransferase